MKTIKIKINQQWLQDLLDEAMTSTDCDVLVRLILGDIRKSKNNLFFERKDEVQISLKPHEALALYLYISQRNTSLDYYYISSIAIVDKLLRAQIISENELNKKLYA